jgi:RNA polymerase sigma factor for flagellar operon FliA
VDRVKLVERHLDVPQRAAAMIFPRVRGYVELEELVALGNAGLAEAAQRYDPTRGASFATFAWYRVQGAIVDGVRRQANLPRRVWARVCALRAASEYLEQRGEREAGAVARGTPMPHGADALASVKAALSAIRTMYVTSLEAALDDGFDPANPATHADAPMEARQRAARLRAAITALPERERAIVMKHYYEGKQLTEVGAELGMSKSWASRLHAQAVDRLRMIYEDDP